MLKSHKALAIGRLAGVLSPSLYRSLSIMRDIESSAESLDKFVVGETADHSLDLRKVRIGQRLDIPYELTVGDSWKDLWHSCFYQHDRLYTSDVFAQSLGFERCLLPFSMMLFMTGSMSHIDDTKEVMDLGFRNAVYKRPAYPGSTFSKTFYITDLRSTSSGQNTIVTVHCDLSDAETHETVFSVDKIMLYPQSDSSGLSPSAQHHPMQENMSSSVVNETILENYSRSSGSSSFTHLRPHQLLLHGASRPITQSTSMGLATLFRLSHPLLYNVERYKPSELVVPGGIVLAAAHGASARSLYEVLAEEMVSCSFVNRVSPEDNISAMSYVVDIDELNAELEQVTIRTVAVKNFDLVRELEGKELPVSLFSTDFLKPTQYEAICKEDIPELSNRIVCSTVRKLVRQSPQHQSIFLL